MLRFRDRSGLLPDGYINPAKNIEKFRETPRERFLSGDELERLGAAIREAETVGRALGKAGKRIDCIWGLGVVGSNPATPTTLPKTGKHPRVTPTPRSSR
jgi:hypothetical protein